MSAMTTTADLSATSAHLAMTGGCAAIGTDAQRAKSSTERSLNGKYLLTLEATNAGTCATRILDEQDARIVTDRLATMDRKAGPRVGDFVVFADSVVRRISHHWHDGAGWDGGMQTSDLNEGRFYLADGSCSYSGALHKCVPTDSLTDTGETRNGSAWIFHHDHARAHNGVDFLAPFRVFTCSEEAPR
jgi:hypothetical protein